MTELRISWSVLYALKRGQQDQAWASYWHLEHDMPQFVIDGQNEAKRWEQEIIKSGGKLPKEFATARIGKVSPEHKFEKQFKLTDDILVTVVGKIDAYGEADTIDFKYSTKPAADWIQTEQGCIYQILRPQANRFWIMAKHPKTGECTTAVRHLSRATAKEGMQFLYSWTTELINIFGLENLDRSNV